MSFENYAIESQLNQESLAECSGKSPIEAARISLTGFSEDNLPMVVALKGLALQMGDLKKQFAAVGDKDSVENLTAAQLDMADQIGSGTSGNYINNQLVAIAIESISLSQLDQNTSYDFLDGETPAQVAQEIKNQKIQLSQTIRSFHALYHQFTESELLNYTERIKTDGELEAMKWVVQQHQQNMLQ